jgi:hypothetical protein
MGRFCLCLRMFHLRNYNLFPLNLAVEGVETKICYMNLMLVKQNWGIAEHNTNLKSNINLFTEKRIILKYCVHLIRFHNSYLKHFLKYV